MIYTNSNKKSINLKTFLRRNCQKIKMTKLLSYKNVYPYYIQLQTKLCFKLVLKCIMFKSKINSSIHFIK